MDLTAIVAVVQECPDFWPVFWQGLIFGFMISCILALISALLLIYKFDDFKATTEDM